MFQCLITFMVKNLYPYIKQESHCNLCCLVRERHQTPSVAQDLDGSSHSLESYLGWGLRYAKSLQLLVLQIMPHGTLTLSLDSFKQSHSVLNRISGPLSSPANCCYNCYLSANYRLGAVLLYSQLNGAWHSLSSCQLETIAVALPNQETANRRFLLELIEAKASGS